jgi:CMP-N,N'-diacetyllegionaminic acid synthase
MRADETSIARESTGHCARIVHQIDESLLIRLDSFKRYKMMTPKILPLILARGGSKGLPRKNVRPLCGKPLIVWTIEQALQSTRVDRVVVSTDDEEIADIALEFGAEVPFCRPEELARDDSPSVDAILHALDWFDEHAKQFDVVMLLEPTHPLRKKDDIDRAIKLFTKNVEQADSLVTLGEIPPADHPNAVKRLEDGYVKPYEATDLNVYQRQQLPEAYCPYGGVYLSKVKEMRQLRTFYQERTIPYLVERWQTYDIDDIYDFVCIEAVMRYRLQQGDFAP